MMSMRSRLKIDNVRIISSMCVGGILYHDLGLRFYSPTINLIIPNFTIFCLDLERNLRQPIKCLKEDTIRRGYPVAQVGDFIIYGVHYKNYDELETQWTRRCIRFFENNEEIVLMATDAQVKTKIDIERFHDLPFRRVCFTSKPDIKYKEFVYIPEFEGKSEVGDILRYKDIFGTRIFEKHFDCVGWLNHEEER